MATRKKITMRLHETKEKRAARKLARSEAAKNAAAKRWAKHRATKALVPQEPRTNRTILPAKATQKELVCIGTYLTTGNKTEAGLAAYDTKDKTSAYKLCANVLKKFGITSEMVMESQGLSLGRVLETINMGLSARKTTRIVTGSAQKGKQKINTFHDIDHAERRANAELLMRLRERLDPGDEEEKSSNSQVLCAEMMHTMHSIRENLEHIRANTARPIKEVGAGEAQ